MSDMMKSFVSGDARKSPNTNDANNKEKLLLGVFAFISLVSMLWLMSSMSKVSEVLADFGQGCCMPFRSCSSSVAALSVC